MNLAKIRQRIKPWMLPIAMLLGLLFHDYIDHVAPIAPYLIFTMLLLTFCKVKPSEFKVTKLTYSLITIQLLGSIALYFMLLPIDPIIAQGTFICVFCPTATAAPVITAMLGGSITRVATYSIVSNLCVALLAAPIFTMINGDHDMMLGAMLDVAWRIFRSIFPLMIAPLLIAMTLQKAAPKVHSTLATHQSLSFYIWAVSLCIVVGQAVSYVIAHHENIPVIISLALTSLTVCCLQFYAGRRIGGKCGDKIAGAQGLGQKNTVLAIWMALNYLNPVASVGPAAYIAWQNTINSLQLYLKNRQL